MSLVLREQVPLAPLTTIGLGGTARYFAETTSVDELAAALTHAADHGLPVQVLGGGSNTVFADGGYTGLVLRLANRGIAFGPGGHRVQVTAAAGEDWDQLVAACVARGLGGLECLSGIPGQVGATPIQNVGAYGQEVGDTITEVRAVDRQTLERITFAGADCGFAYRGSRFRHADAGRYVVVEVVFDLEADARPEVRYPELQRRLEQESPWTGEGRGAAALDAVRQTVVALRRGKSMVVAPDDPDSRSAGSFFVNPVLPNDQLALLRCRLTNPEQLPCFAVPGGSKIAAAWLIEQAGFRRGLCRGGVGISSRHALALVNRGGTTRDLLALAAEIQSGVEARFGVWLQIEPVVVG